MLSQFHYHVHQQLLKVLRLKRLNPFFRWLFILILVLPILVISGLSCFRLYHAFTELTYSRKQALANLTSWVVKERLDLLKDLGVALASHRDLTTPILQFSWNEAIEQFKNIPRDFPFIERIFLVDQTGTLMADTPHLLNVVGRNFSYQDWFIGVSDNWQPYISQVYKRVAEPHYNVVALSVPIKQEDIVLGILVLQVKLDHFLKGIPSLEKGLPETILIVDHRGHVAYHPKFFLYDDVVNLSSVPSVQKVLEGREAIGVLFDPIEKRENVVAIKPVFSYGWGVVVQQAAHQAFSLRNSVLKHHIFIYGSLFLLYCILVYFILTLLENIYIQQQREGAFLESIGDGVMAIHKDYTVTLWNKTAESISGWRRDEVLGRPFHQFIHFISEKSRSEDLFFIEKVLSKGEMQAVETDTFLIGREDKEVPVAHSAAPVFDEQGKIIGAIVIFRDITERRLKEKELRESKETLENQARDLQKTNEEMRILYREFEKKNEELKKLDQLKDDFVSTVSHELRTPLSITKEGISLVLDRIAGEVNKKQGQILGTARDNIDRLARLINDLLDISKIESGKVELKRTLVNLNSLLKHVVYSFENKVAAKGLELRAIFPEKGVEVYADADKIIQVLTNLVGNALKFTEKGHIKVTLVDQQSEVDCSIEDSGVGIAPEDIPRVFEKFQQFGRTAGPGEKGTGLGLAISKRLIEMHNGRMWVESQLGEGTRFIFSLPKYDSAALFREYLHSGMKEVMKAGTKLSLIVVSIKEFQRIRQKLAVQKLDAILKDIELLVKHSLRRSGDADVMFRETGEAAVVLVDCEKENAFKVLERIKQVLIDYLFKEASAEKIQLHFGCVTYPDDGLSDEELLAQARRLAAPINANK